MADSIGSGVHKKVHDELRMITKMNGEQELTPETINRLTGLLLKKANASCGSQYLSGLNKTTPPEDRCIECGIYNGSDLEI